MTSLPRSASSVTTGERCVDLAPLPGADGEGVATREVDGALQAGFSVPMELIRDPQAEFAVSVDEDPPRELPRPTVREPGPSVWRNTDDDLTPAMSELRHEVAEVKARAEREQERISLLQDVLAEARQAEAAAREEALGTTGLLDQTRTERDDLGQPGRSSPRPRRRMRPSARRCSTRGCWSLSRRCWRVTGSWRPSVSARRRSRRGCRSSCRPRRLRALRCRRAMGSWRPSVSARDLEAARGARRSRAERGRGRGRDWTRAQRACAPAGAGAGARCGRGGRAG